MKFHRIALAALTFGALSVGGMSFAAESNNPLDPSYKHSLMTLTESYFDMLMVMDTDRDGRISEKEFINSHDPLSPAYEKAKAQFTEMMRMMDANKDGMIGLEEYMASANPLHPSHKFTKN